MPYGSVIAAGDATVESIENFGNTTLHVINFQRLGVGGPGTVYNSSLPAIIGHWFHSTTDPTQTKEGVDTSLISASTGQIRLTFGESGKSGKLYLLSLT